MRKFLAIALLCVAISACHEKKGPLERAGERIDEIGDNIADGDPPLKRKGPLEKAGESVDDALGRR